MNQQDNLDFRIAEPMLRIDNDTSDDIGFRSHFIEAVGEKLCCLCKDFPANLKILLPPCEK